MGTFLPPPPVSNDPKDPSFRDWFYKLQQFLANAGNILFTDLDFTGSNITSIATRNHADLQDLNTASYTHLTATDHTDLTDGGTTTLHTHNASIIPLEKIGASTFDSVQDMQNLFHSAGYVSGGAVTDNGDGTVAIAVGTGVIRVADDELSAIKFFDWVAVASQAISDGNENWVYIDYNAGAPIVTASTTEPPNHHVFVKLAAVHRDGTTIHINQTVRFNVGDHASNMVQNMQETMGVQHVSGATLSETGTRNLAVTAGVFWHGLNRFNTSALDTNVSGSFTTYYQDGIGGWTRTASQTVVNNTQYDDGSGTLASLSPNRYTNRWVYLATGSNVYVVYGQTQAVQLSDAASEEAPSSLPAELNTDSFLIGRIIIKEGDTNFFQIDSAFMQTFATASVNVHNSLSGLQGGTAGEYYHLTAAEYTALGTAQVKVYEPTMSGTFFSNVGYLAAEPELPEFITSSSGDVVMAWGGDYAA
jgi:hypothetical protein